MVKITMFVMAAWVLVFSAVLANAGGVTQVTPVKEYFLSSQLSMSSYLSNELTVKNQQDDDFRGDIYEFHTKSPFKAFVFSLAIPGAGQYYNGSKIKAGTFLATDVLLWSGYLIYHNKGTNKEGDYRDFANQNYHWTDYDTWWRSLPDTAQLKYSHRLPMNDAGTEPNFNHEYYENIGKYDQFQVGWDDVGLNHPPPENYPSALRNTYLSMRKQANDYFSNATTMAMVSIANHLISAFDAAIGARKYNRGTKQYSLDLKTRNIDGRVVPFMVMAAKF